MKTYSELFSETLSRNRDISRSAAHDIVVKSPEGHAAYLQHLQATGVMKRDNGQASAPAVTMSAPARSEYLRLVAAFREQNVTLSARAAHRAIQHSPEGSAAYARHLQSKGVIHA